MHLRRLVVDRSNWSLATSPDLSPESRLRVAKLELIQHELSLGHQWIVKNHLANLESSVALREKKGH